VSRLVAGAELARLTLLGALVAGCQGGDSAMLPSAPSARVTFGVSNSLVAPVTLSVDGMPYAIMTSGSSTTLTVSAEAQWLTWTSAKPKDADGNMIPDDIGQVRIAVAGINRQLDIGNVINDQPYFTARIHNDTPVPVSIGVYNGQSVSCAGVLPPAANGVTGFVIIGYYRLTQSTEVRAFRDPGCTGPYAIWSRSTLAMAEPNTGVVTLILENAP
jgi:hypothetical protein